MIRNGYKIKLGKNEDVTMFVDKLRDEFRHLTDQLCKKLVAREVERLYDFKYIECAEYEKSILDTAIESVNGRIAGVTAGAYRDGKFDMRSTLTIVKIDKNELTVLFNTSNEEIKKYFESIDTVSSYKYYADEIDEDITEEENNERGHFWQAVFEKSNFNSSMTGFMAQISNNEDLSKKNIVAEDLKEFFRTTEERLEEFVSKKVIIGKVSSLIGSVPIDKVAPFVLDDFFKEAYLYEKSPEGQRDAKRIREKVKSGFVSVNLVDIGLN